MSVRQPLGVTVGNTHASSVIVVVRSSELASLTVTQSFTPSNASAAPNRPLGVRVAPLTVPVLALPDESTTWVPFASSNP